VLQRYACCLSEYVVADLPKEAANFATHVSHDDDRLHLTLLGHLCPQLRVCLLAEVAAGLLVPGWVAWQ
jgi:hypothetical protein